MIEDAFRWARIHAMRHMAACDEAGLRWGETSITEIVTSRTAEAVTVVPFTQRAEAQSGADWVWWWVDGRGAYGMLVQAKRVVVSREKWKFDFGYRSGAGTQRSTLLATARLLGLLPVYGLYLGTGDYRRWERCSEMHQGGRCLQCVKRSVSMMPALLADLLVVNATTTYARSVALEQMLVPPQSQALVIPALKAQMSPDLQQFLTARQDGTLAVTRSMIDRILRARYSQMSAVSVADRDTRRSGEHDQLGSVFRQVPNDSGHWDVNYLEHALNPLRPVPPSYVLDVLSADVAASRHSVEDRVGAEMPDNVAGLIVVRLPSER